MQLDLSVVVPTLNECRNIDPLVRGLRSNLASLQWEAIFVDDGSEDGTTAAIMELSLEDPRIRLLQRNERGLASACVSGMRVASGSVIAIMDADGQHDSAMLLDMLFHLKSHSAEIVVASRYLPESRIDSFGLFRRTMTGVASWLYSISRHRQLTDPMSGFFIIKQTLVNDLLPSSCYKGFKLLPNLLSSLPPHYRVAEVPFSFGRRSSGRSKVGPIIVMDCALRMLINAVERRVSHRQRRRQPAGLRSK